MKTKHQFTHLMARAALLFLLVLLPQLADGSSFENNCFILAIYKNGK